ASGAHRARRRRRRISSRMAPTGACDDLTNLSDPFRVCCVSCTCTGACALLLRRSCTSSSDSTRLH
ncbi:MAG: hypothetical protein MHM6MM_005461, partial [Cercozoa sp. M6MM]